MIPRRPVYAVLGFVSSLLTSPAPTSGEEPPPFVLQWGGPSVVGAWGSRGTEPGQFYHAGAIDLDGSGNVYIIDGDPDGFSYRVQKFDAAGQFLTQWGSSGTAWGQFFDKTLAVSEEGLVYVGYRAVGSGQHVQKFDSNGNLLQVWDADIIIQDVGPTGEVFVWSRVVNQIQVYNPDGVLLRQFGGTGGVVTDPDGNVYMNSSYYDATRGTFVGRVQKFDSEGTLLAILTPFPAGRLSADAMGHIYVTDFINHSVQVFSNDGIFLDMWGGGGASVSPGYFDTPRDITATPAGRFYVIDGGVSFDRVQVFDFSHGGGFQLAFDVTVDAVGQVYVGDRDGIQKFDGSGNLLLAWGSHGSANGEVNIAAGIAVDPGGRVFVVDSGNHRIQKFSQGGAFLDKWGGFGSGPGSFSAPFGIAVDASAHVYVADTGNHRIQRFDDQGAFQVEWGGLGSGPGQLSSPTGVAVDTDGFVYVADLGNHRVQKFTADGGFVAQWGGLGTSPGQFDRPHDVFVDRFGGVYVAEMGNDRIQKFDQDGNWLTAWGATGSGPGQFESPTGISVDAQGNVFVLDAGNVRVQRFGAPPTLLVAFDLHPRECPNPLNPSSRGKTPAALVGSASFDVGSVDVSTLRLEGVVPAQQVTPIDLVTPSEACECTRAGADGVTDLSMTFDTQAIVQVLGPLRRGEVRALRLSGNLLDGTPIEGHDCVTVLHDTDSAGPPLNPGTRVELASRREAFGSTIVYTLPVTAPVRLAAYDVSGRLVARLVDAVQPQGRHEFHWDTRGVARGVYWLRLAAGPEVVSHKLVVLPSSPGGAGAAHE